MGHVCREVFRMRDVVMVDGQNFTQCDAHHSDVMDQSGRNRNILISLESGVIAVLDHKVVKVESGHNVSHMVLQWEMRTHGWTHGSANIFCEVRCSYPMFRLLLSGGRVAEQPTSI